MAVCNRHGNGEGAWESTYCLAGSRRRLWAIRQAWAPETSKSSYLVKHFLHLSHTYYIQLTLSNSVISYGSSIWVYGSHPYSNHHTLSVCFWGFSTSQYVSVFYYFYDRIIFHWMCLLQVLLRCSTKHLGCIYLSAVRKRAAVNMCYASNCYPYLVKCDSNAQLGPKTSYKNFSKHLTIFPELVSIKASILSSKFWFLPFLCSWFYYSINQENIWSVS